jgi:anti-sigma regulatory factor (Ser/Thr protein kinase)
VRFEGRAGLDELIRVDDARRECAAALDRLDACCRAAALSAPVVLELRVVAEEVLTNVAKYGFEADRAPAVELHLTFTEAAAVLEFRDQGRAFDPLAEPPPDLETPPEERPAGGLGLVLVRALVDEVLYEREGTANVLRLVKRRSAQ